MSTAEHFLLISYTGSKSVVGKVEQELWLFFGGILLSLNFLQGEKSGSE